MRSRREIVLAASEIQSRLETQTGRAILEKNLDGVLVAHITAQTSMYGLLIEALLDSREILEDIRKKGQE